MAPVRRARASFVVGTGRCGSQFLHAALLREPGIAAHHETLPVMEAFYRYARFNRLPVDTAPLLHAVGERAAAAGPGRATVDISAWLSLHVTDLHDAFDARVVLLARNPFDTVRSLMKKGWYATPHMRRDPSLALGYHELGQPHYGFSRLVPRGSEGTRWATLTRAGKCAWYWNAINSAILDSFEALPSERRRVVHLEQLDFGAYRDLVELFGAESAMEPAAFAELRRRRPGRIDLPSEGWSERELDEIAVEARDTTERLGCSMDALLSRQTVGHGTRAPVTVPRTSKAILPPGAIVATLGFENRAREDVEWLVAAGVRAFRVNFGRFSPEHNAAVLDQLEEVRRDEPCVVVADLPGAKMRVGRFASAPHLDVSSEQPLWLTLTADQEDAGSVPVQSPEFFDRVSSGQTITFSNSPVLLEVLQVQPRRVRVNVVRGGRLTKHSGLWLSGPYAPYTTLCEQDRRLLAQLRGGRVDYVAISFADTPAVVREARRLAPEMAFLAKLESPLALLESASILDVADGLMLGRDDLSRHLALEQVDGWLHAHATDGVRHNKPLVAASRYVTVDGGRGRIDRPDEIVALLQRGVSICLSETGAIVNWRDVVADALELQRVAAGC